MIVQNIIVRKAAGYACLVFFIPAAPKYNASVYIIVSEAPIIIDAHLPAKLSAPFRTKSSFTVAFAALPERGRTKTSGTISEGNPILDVTGTIRSHNVDIAPLLENIPNAVISITNTGIRPTAVFSPSFAPSTNAENRSCFEQRSNMPVNVSIPGTK